MKGYSKYALRLTPLHGEKEFALYLARPLTKEDKERMPPNSDMPKNLEAYRVVVNALDVATLRHLSFFWSKNGRAFAASWAKDPDFRRKASLSAARAISSARAAKPSRVGDQGVDTTKISCRVAWGHAYDLLGKDPKDTVRVLHSSLSRYQGRVIWCRSARTSAGKKWNRWEGMYPDQQRFLKFEDKWLKEIDSCYGEYIPEKESEEEDLDALDDLLALFGED